jgi:integrase
MAMLKLLKGSHEKRKHLTVHGFRSTFRDWAGETTNHRREVIEHALAHKLADQAEAAYQRGDYFEKRRVLMQDWADYLLPPMNSKKTGEATVINQQQIA